MLDSLRLKLVWLIIEQKKADISPKASDSEIVQQIMDKLQSHMIFSTTEQFDIYLYVQSQIPLIRDLAEIQSVEISGKQRFIAFGVETEEIRNNKSGGIFGSPRSHLKN